MTQKAKNIKKSLNETEIEVGISHVLKTVFPWIRREDIQHQVRFSIRIGHKTVKTNGNRNYQAVGRCDILLSYKDQPLAILELKRQGLSLTDDDRKQGLSYARLTDPMSPLVIVTNGDATNLFNVYSGESWSPESKTEEEFRKLVNTTAKLASEDIRDAVEILLGPESSAWVSIIHAITNGTLEDLTGPWDNPLIPFPRDLLFQRKATEDVLKLLDKEKFILVSGSPLVGKSNVLREMAIRAEKREDIAVLLLDASSSSQGVFQILANSFSNDLGWPATEENVRSWLRKLSKSESGPSLVLAIDGGAIDNIRPTLDELVSGAYGIRLKLVLSVDEASVSKLTKNVTGRQLTRLGKFAKIVSLGPLDDDEFTAATQTLDQYRIGFMRGGHRAQEFRLPWILRSICADAVNAEEYKNDSLEAAIPSIPGLNLLHIARERFSQDDLLMGGYMTLAEAVLADAEKRGQSLSFTLASLNAFVCSHETSRNMLGENEFEILHSAGYFKDRLLETSERIIVPHIPELLAASLATVMAQKLIKDLKDSVETAGDQLVALCASLPTGDVIGAQAIFEAAQVNSGVSLDLIRHLLQLKPREEAISPGMRATMLLQGIRVEMKYQSDGSIIMSRPDGQRLHLPLDPDESPDVMYANTTSWLILSHLATMPIAVFNKKSAQQEGWFDPAILIEVGSCPIPLRRPLTNEEFDGNFVHEMRDHGATIVCHKEGIVEPITLALMNAMGRDLRLADHIISIAKEINNLPLFARLHIALSQLSFLKDRETADWASKALSNDIYPAIQHTGLVH